MTERAIADTVGRLRLGDGQTRRIRCPVCPPTKRAALSVTRDGSTLLFCCHRCGARGRVGDVVSVRGPTRRVDPAEDQRRREAHQARVVVEWARASFEGVGAHPYLVRKHLPGHGTKRSRAMHYSATGTIGDALVIPMRDASGKVANLQGIAPDGDRRFMHGVPAKGCFALVPPHAAPWRAPNETVAHICIGEGYATVAAFIALHGSKWRGVAAMSADNLPIAARLFRDRFPSASIAILVDRDPKGAEMAGAAKYECRGAAFIPPEPFNDWSDVLIAVRERSLPWK